MNSRRTRSRSARRTPHEVELARELGDLVAPARLDRRREVTGRDAVRGLLEHAQAPRQPVGGGVGRRRRRGERHEAGDDERGADQAHVRERVGERHREQHDVSSPRSASRPRRTTFPGAPPGPRTRSSVAAVRSATGSRATLMLRSCAESSCVSSASGPSALENGHAPVQVRRGRAHRVVRARTRRVARLARLPEDDRQRTLDLVDLRVHEPVLETRDDHQVDDRQRAGDRAEEDECELDRQRRPKTGHGAHQLSRNRYPAPRTVKMYSGSLGSRSIFSRRWRTWTSIVRGSRNAAPPQRRSSSVWRE